MGGFAELCAGSNFSFLRGASHPEEMVAEAARLGLAGLGLADRNTLAGVVRAHTALKETGAGDAGLRLAVGARLVFADNTPDILAYPSDRAAYGRLCRLLTLGKRRARKGECLLHLADLLEHAEGLLLILLRPPRFGPDIVDALERLAEAAPGALWLGVAMSYGAADQRRFANMAALAARVGAPLLAVSDALYHGPDRRALQDVLTCVREHCTIETAGRRLEANAERHLKSPAEMARLFRHAPGAIEESLRFLERCRFSLDELRYEYPDEPVPPGRTAQEHLTALVKEGAARRFPEGVPPRVEENLTRELALIEQLDYAPYFLTVHDIVAFAETSGILCQGRGSAANSVVCYCLGVTAVDPTRIDLLFERFISAERREPPDIDVDFEHERREEVIQYIYERYGRERAGIAATVIRYRPRSAIRDIGKALGLTQDVTGALANTVWGSWGKGFCPEQMRQAGLDPANPLIKRAVEMASALIGFPRHLSQHVGGFVLTRGRLDETVPVGPAAMADRTFIEWDKDDIDALGIMKVDVLALGMLTCIRKAFEMMAAHGRGALDLASLPREDPAVYAMLQKADSVGVFQVESRAQMNMLPRLKPANFYDLVIEVAIVRPGPIQGDMVHPYLKRRKNPDLVRFPKPAPEHGPPDELARVLGKTLGVPLFQEQAMRIAIEAAKFTPEEANRLRRAMATFRRVGTIHTFQRQMVEGMTRRGYERAFAENCFRQIEGFGEYGFPESHAASFALLVYASAWLKCRHPAIFAAALLNSQPMGFYAPAQILRDAIEHKVDIRPVDINASGFDNSLEERADGALALRLGFRQIDGFRKDWSEAIVAARQGAYPTLEALRARAGLPRQAIARLAEADAFGSLGLHRRAALWAACRLPEGPTLPLFAAAGAGELAEEPAVTLAPMAASEQVVADYQMLRLSLKAHPVSFLRALYAQAKILSCREAVATGDGRRVACAGIVLVRQRPGSAKGVVFMTIEDETGNANIVIWPSLIERYRREIMLSRLILVEGRVQKSPEGITHLVAERLIDRSLDLTRLADGVIPVPLAHADEVARPVPDGRHGGHGHRHPRDLRVVPKSRDFH